MTTDFHSPTLSSSSHSRLSVDKRDLLSLW